MRRRLPAGADLRRTRSATLAESFDPRHNSLNALRLAFATAVIVSHAWPLGGFGSDPMLGDLSLGTWAVAGFFVISGYLIAGSRRRSDLGSYLARRFLRIFPGLWVCLLAIVVVFVPIAALRDAGVFPPPFREVAKFLLGNGALVSHDYGIKGTLTTVPYSPGSWDGSIWTLFYEVAWYILTGVLLSLVFVRRTPWTLTAAFVAVAGVHALDVERNVISYGRLSLLAELGTYFLAGVVLQAWESRVPMRGWIAMAAGALIVGSAALHQATDLAALPLAYLCLWAGIKLPLQRVGRRNDISYGVYIYAFPIQQLLVLYGAASLGLGPYILLSIALTVPLATLSWFGVERPALRRRARAAALLAPA